MLHIVLPVHNRRPITEGFVRALFAQTVRDYRLLLVDDGCGDGTVAAVQSLLPAERLAVTHGDGQLWWAGALQRAWQLLSALPAGDADTVLIINDDVSFASNFLARGLDALREKPGACLQAIGIGRACGTVDRGAIADLTRLRFRAAEFGETPNCLSTRGLLMEAKTFQQSGGFRPRLLPHYLSDYEFTIRLHRRGTPLVVDERFVAEVDFAKTGLSGLIEDAPSNSNGATVTADVTNNFFTFSADGVRIVGTGGAATATVNENNFSSIANDAVAN
jgi:GT2 family glycosyltransferase